MNTSLTKLTTAIALSCLAFSATPLHASHKTSRIIGGVEAPANSYSWIASLQTIEGEHFCGGSLVAPEWIMTAAHCVEDEQASQVKVVVAEYDTSSSEPTDITRSVKRIISHEEYGEDNDIALLHLSDPIDNGMIQTANSDLMDNLASGTKVKVMGWGNLSTEGEDFPNKLHEVDVELVSSESCTKAYENIGSEITENMLCASVPGGGKDSCQGDSGGPLVFQRDNEWIQLGIVSFGEGCGLPDHPGVYSKVSAYQDWIQKAQNQLPDESENNDSDDDDFDFEQPFGLPDYVLVETDLDSDLEYRAITLTNTNQVPLQVSKVEITPLEFEGEFDDHEYDEDIGEEESFHDEGDDGYDSENTDRESSDQNVEDLVDGETENTTLFNIHEDKCSNLTLEPNQSCDITVSFSDDIDSSKYLRSNSPRHFSDDDYENHFDDEYEDNDFDPDDNYDYGEWDDADDEFGEDDLNQDDFSEYDEDAIHFEDEHENVLIIDELLTIETNDDEHDVIEIPLIAAIELPEPKLIGPDYLEFNATNPNQTITEIFEIENNSDTDVTITSMSIEGSNAFSISDDKCTSEVLGENAICSAVLEFTPNEATESEGVLIVNYDDNESVQIPLFGLVYNEIDMPDEYSDIEEDIENLLSLFDWYFNGETPWGLSNADAFELVTDLLNENDEALLMTQVEGPATLDFDFSLEGDSPENELHFIVDGQVVKTINGTSSKSQHSTELSEGKHTIQWMYKKKTQNSDSKAKVSNVRIKPKSNSVSSTETENGGGSAGFGLIALVASLFGFRRFRK